VNGLEIGSSADSEMLRNGSVTRTPEVSEKCGEMVASA
jgi:hypothetical protein